jgi:hypothetical protein
MGNCTKPQHLTVPEDEIENQVRTHVTLKASTWLRDSHELFDYESPNLKRKVIDISNSCSLVRD